MRKLALIVALVFGVLLTSSSSFAQAVRGDKQIGFQGFLNTFIVEGDTIGALLVIGNLGYYVTETSEVRGGGLLTQSFGAEENETLVGIVGGYRYHLTARGKLVPYFGGDFQFIDLGEDSATILSGQVGFNYYFQRHMALDVSGSVGRGFGGGGSATVIVARFGLAFIL